VHGHVASSIAFTFFATAELKEPKALEEHYYHAKSLTILTKMKKLVLPN